MKSLRLDKTLESSTYKKIAPPVQDIDNQAQTALDEGKPEAVKPKSDQVDDTQAAIEKTKKPVFVKRDLDPIEDARADIKETKEPEPTLEAITRDSCAEDNLKVSSAEGQVPMDSMDSGIKDVSATA